RHADRRSHRSRPLVGAHARRRGAGRVRGARRQEDRDVDELPRGLPGPARTVAPALLLPNLTVAGRLIDHRSYTQVTPGGDHMTTTMQRAEAAEHAMSEELDRIVVKSVLYTSGERDPRVPVPRPPDQGKLYLMGHDPRLPKMPDKPTLFDFFRYRFGPSAHTLQSARSADTNGPDAKSLLD